MKNATGAGDRRKSRLRRRRAFLRAARVRLGSFLRRRRMSEAEFKQALLEGIKDLAGSGIIHDPQKAEEPCVPRSI
jgi:hypothetical protein